MTHSVEPEHDRAVVARRTDPPLRAPEAQTLLAFLDYHRDTLRIKVAGLDRAQLGRTVAPSAMTLGGLVKHLALVEDSWFSVVLDGEAHAAPWDSVAWDDDPDWEWRTGSTGEPADLMATYEDNVARADRHIAAALDREGLDTRSVRTSRHGAGAFSLRWILLHMIEEYARHNGHADLLRESIDGQVGE